MKIKKYSELVEAISGWELVGKHTMGPNYPEQKLPTSLSTEDTEVIMGKNGKFYTKSDFIDYLYPEYLSKFPGQILDEFTQKNLDIIIDALEIN